MAINKKVIQRRIKTVKNTRKITKAMELVSAAKMKRATEAVIGSRPYVTHLRELVREISHRTDVSAHPLLHRREGRERILLILVMSDRGLCGGYNVQMVRKTRAFLEKHAEGVEVDIVTVGKRAGSAARQLNLNIIGHYPDISGSPKAEDARPIIKLAMDGYMSETYDDVFLCYTDFKSAITQTPRIMPLLPLAKMFEDFGEVPEHVLDTQEKPVVETVTEPPEFLFEPDAKQVLNRVLPRIVESMLYQGMLESSASEHAARMMAMKSASEAAEEMIDTLTLYYNQARQAGITQEIAEISGGKAALE
ncbi:ATP synthase F1 subunit gamma [Candidatus Uhrbacteria bacterium CG10_big_fil_rev_8_21_14_0_10_50_16]|uniref:ATP synthase gamma chain n=1 Tax=Candidatus Uhrbacteria bacterium CG10_big_fil_rev_8_21_14_0_10_50_16 TaxID=1975039 RepID=A0A2H0RN96_9BACT|nr:MAG: ATP synthase F1 subunit gamma [Candidatus Uhrbacteria bacterium CG10_big_fil_rev_8_21_14_0_10_50_16]